jgi:hypothetical protein
MLASGNVFRPGDQDHQHQHHRQGWRPFGLPEQAGHAFGHTQENTGEQRPAQIADAADHDDGERLDRQRKAHVGTDWKRHRVQHRRHRHRGRPEGEGQRAQGGAVDAAHHGADLVLRHGANAASEPGAGEKQVHGGGEQGNADQDGELGGRDDDITHLERFKAHADIALGGTGQHRRHITDDDHRPHRHQHRAHRAFEVTAFAQRVQELEVERIPRQEDGGRQQQRYEKRMQLVLGEQNAGDHASHGQQGAMREIEDANDAVDQRQPKGHQRIQPAQQQATEGNLEYGFYVHVMPEAARLAPGRPLQ